ncbi:methyltransferase domain-containing protein [Pectobacterium aroidearum]|uniref:methyltransferase domain-containing protein n=1 Tax=Pectobacterium aroidearum TaxID=1201031 RepID=UPI0021146F88|nr:methyltransferase domain-containing protein [Pectobacterium aroidearum]UUE43673.1 methyltransferase domain-containing protein [Pectobacterium aroidearum]UUE47893.1 methyltransferase domain-containing protein [Pectobacterium aroidearum]UUE52098.1 methyltransferase domain-containing protein [Pectobacterium aroidearum]UUE60507.1 methyltransferase domain-containing protein [Pectobacterium aroidearum]UUE64730.1 methyltransferase domain-containing protein [Pectobacterium aroidearum]
MNPLETLWQLAASSVKADALHLALEQQIFDRLEEASTPEQLAATLGWQPEKTGFLLELLWSMQLLTRHHDGYRTDPTCATVLCRSSSRFLGDAWRFRLTSLRQFGQGLGDGMHQPLPTQLTELPRDAAWANAAEQQIAQEQRAVTADRAEQLLSSLPDFPQIRHVLDLGGGPGWVAITLALRHAQISGTVYDLPQTAAVAQRNIDAAGLSARLSAQSGTLPREKYDLIWSSSFLHFVEDIPAMLKTLRDTLAPEGTLVLAQAEIADEADEAAPVLPFYLPMQMSGRHVTREGQLVQWLLAAGFTFVETRRHQAFPMAPLNVLIARKHG